MNLWFSSYELFIWEREDAVMRCLQRLHWEKTLTACFGGSEEFASYQQYIRHIRLPTLLEKKFGKLYLVDEVSHLLLKEKPLEAYFLLRDKAEQHTRNYYQTTNESSLSLTLWTSEERMELAEMYDSYLREIIGDHPFFQFYLMGKHTDACLEDFLKGSHKKEGSASEND